MRERGFTLVELIVAMAIMVILLSIAVLSWSEMLNKSAVESQIKTIHADLMQVRLKALFGKRSRCVVINEKEQVFKIYSSEVTSVPALETKQLRFPIISNVKNALSLSVLTFDAQGLLNGSERSLCILPTDNLLVINSAAVDSIVISQARLNMGKRTEVTCASDSIEQQ